jgi:putative pyruvate formate lyase activating enzyme
MSIQDIGIHELKQRAERLRLRLVACDICPRRCHVNRLQNNTGICHSGLMPVVASYCSHHGEEPALSGSRGSGTIFFANCNLHCVFCQNFQISQNFRQQQINRISTGQLAGYMLELQAQGCHNINLVSPSHFVPQIVEALTIALPAGLNLPLVYNTNAYDSLETLRELDGIIDIYLPDIKYASDDMATQYSGAPNYTSIARQSIREMWRQTGKLTIDENGIAQKGLIVRHLILPENIAGTDECLKWLSREISAEVSISLMTQYHPTYHAQNYSRISRHISESEYEAALHSLEEAGLENGWVQDMEAHENYLPDFEREGHPFEHEASG